MELTMNKNRGEETPTDRKTRILNWFSGSFKLTPIEAQAAASGTMIFVFGALLLIALNWDNKIYALFLSIAFCGALAAFISVGALLKEETIRETFFVSIPFDIKTGNLPFIIPHIPPDAEHVSALLRLMELSSMAGRVGFFEWPEEPPKGTELDEEIFRYCGELLQYQMFRILYRLQDNIWLASQLGARVDPVDPADKEVDSRIALSKTSQFQGGHILAFLSGNRFAQPVVEQLFWNQSQMHLPEHTRIKLGEIAPPSGVGYVGHKVLLTKGGFFEMGLSVTPVAATGPGILPMDLYLPDEERRNVRTFQYTINLLANFSKFTAGNTQTGELKQWTRRLFRMIKESLAEGSLPRKEPVSEEPPPTKETVSEKPLPT